MEIRIRKTGEVIQEDEFLDRHKAVSFPPVLSPEILDGFGADAVLISPKPAVGPGSRVVRNGAVQDANGNWMQSWKVTP